MIRVDTIDVFVYDAGMSYTGGKSGNGVYHSIINHMPPHKRYIEPFLGGGGIMRLKRPAQENIGVEIDPDVIALRDASETTVINGDGIAYLKHTTFTQHDLVYYDPPYL